MRCPRCGSENPSAKRFCGDCGAPFTNRCPKCDAENPPSKRFYGDCGAVLTGSVSTARAKTLATTLAETIRVTPEQLDTSIAADGERKAVTALFADIKGSTELMCDLDPEEARAIVDPVLQLMMAAVHRDGGYVVQSTGDGIFAIFGAPLATRTIHSAHFMRRWPNAGGVALLCRPSGPHACWLPLMAL